MNDRKCIKCSSPAIAGQRRCAPCAARHREKARVRQPLTSAAAANARRAATQRGHAIVRRAREALRVT